MITVLNSMSHIETHLCPSHLPLGGLHQITTAWDTMKTHMILTRPTLEASSHLLSARTRMQTAITMASVAQLSRREQVVWHLEV